MNVVAEISLAFIKYLTCSKHVNIYLSGYNLFVSFQDAIASGTNQPSNIAVSYPPTTYKEIPCGPQATRPPPIRPPRKGGVRPPPLVYWKQRTPFRLPSPIIGQVRWMPTSSAPATSPAPITSSTPTTSSTPALVAPNINFAKNYGKTRLFKFLPTPGLNLPKRK